MSTSTVLLRSCTCSVTTGRAITAESGVRRVYGGGDPPGAPPCGGLRDAVDGVRAGSLAADMGSSRGPKATPCAPPNGAPPRRTRSGAHRVSPAA